MRKCTENGFTLFLFFVVPSSSFTFRFDSKLLAVHSGLLCNNKYNPTNKTFFFQLISHDPPEITTIYLYAILIQLFFAFRTHHLRAQWNTYFFCAPFTRTMTWLTYFLACNLEHPNLEIFRIKTFGGLCAWWCACVVCITRHYKACITTRSVWKFLRWQWVLECLVGGVSTALQRTESTALSVGDELTDLQNVQESAKKRRTVNHWKAPQNAHGSCTKTCKMHERIRCVSDELSMFVFTYLCGLIYACSSRQPEVNLYALDALSLTCTNESELDKISKTICWWRVSAASTYKLQLECLDSVVPMNIW